MLEIRGEMAFKVGAYRRAADSMANSPIDISAAYRAGTPPQLAGVGKAIDEKLAELADTGRLRFYERLRRDVPPSVVTLLAVPGLGPRTAGDLWRQAGIASLDDLERGRLDWPAAFDPWHQREDRGKAARRPRAAAQAAGPSDAPGCRGRHRRPSFARCLVDAGCPAGGRCRLLPAPAGDGRRPRPARRDRQSGRGHRPIAQRRLGRARGRPRRTAGWHSRTTVQLRNGPQLDVMTMPPGVAGTYLVHFTGSAAHNVRLREIARDRGWSLSRARLRPAGRRRRGRDRVGCGTSHLRDRGRGLRLPGPALHRARAARGPRRDRGSAGRSACRRSFDARSSRATATPTPTGRTATSRLRA